MGEVAKKRVTTVEVPVPVVLLVPMSAAIGADVDALAADARELVELGNIKLDGVRVNFRTKGSKE